MPYTSSSFSLPTKRLLLRSWKESDLEPFILMNEDPEIMRFFPNSLTEKESIEMVERIHWHFEVHGFGFYALELKESGEFIGFTGLWKTGFESFFTPCVEIGWRLKKSAWGKGLGCEAANACLDYGFNQLKLESIYSFTSVLNKRSEKLMQVIGMKYAGEFDHPKIPLDHPLCRHVLYVKNHYELPSDHN